VIDFVTDFAPIADDIRDLHRDFGTRPYRVWLLVTRWSGSRRGEGREAERAERELLPTPRLSGIESLERALHIIGSDEHGDIELSEISLARETEATLLPHVNDDTQYWYEVRYDDGRRRRFFPAGPPERMPGEVGWRMRLREQDQARSERGRLAA
jgi:hypothetical protein